MGVKDLVGIFDPPPHSIQAEKEQTQSRKADSSSPSQTQSYATTSHALGSTLRKELAPINARFIQHENRQATPATPNDEPDGLPFVLTNDLTTSDDSLDTDTFMESTMDVTDELPLKSLNTSSFISSMRNTLDPTSSLTRRHGREPYSPDNEVQSLLSAQEHTYPPDDSTLVSSSRGHQRALSIPLRRFDARASAPHSAIPAVTVFSRKAAPLYLPKLDEYVASLPPPTFSNLPPKRSHKNDEATMFPPMDRLAVSGRTLEDLETNNSVPPFWRNRKSILGGLTNALLSITGSSALASFYSLQGLFNTVQVFALILSTIVPRSGKHLVDKWRQLFLGTIPNILALNFASTLVQSLIFLLVFMTIAALLLLYFFRATTRYRGSGAVEGSRSHEFVGSSWGLMVVTFLLTVIYLPLSTMAIHVLVWSQDLWVVPNPYINSTSTPPDVAPLGPSDQFRDPFDFCWTTTMKRNDVNFAPIFVIFAFLAFLSLTVWFPLRLRQAIIQSMPVVDPFTELGKMRSKSEMDREYQRLLARDHNPFAFLYKGFRRDWGTFESTYLLAKLTTLLIIAFIDPDNCVFRTLSRDRLAITRQVLLLIAMVVFFLIQCFVVPFLDPVNNASEFTSRINYVATAAVSLAVALNIPGQTIINGPVLYIIYIITYGLSVYFTVINMSAMHIVVKKLSRRIDFSIDIFSPRLDISSSSPHTRRRIWQESISTLFLTSPECAIPKDQPMIFAQAPDGEYPPYLLNFSGSPSERHVENLKILREVGLSAYNKGVSLVYGPDYDWFKNLADQIQDHFIGPDCYWKNPIEHPTPGYTKYFGNGWWIPFPPTLVIRMDDGPLVAIKEVSDMVTFVAQNNSPDIQRKRQIRMALRALDGQMVNWPYKHVQPVGARDPLCCGGRRYKAQTATPYRHGVLRIMHRGNMVWQDLQFGSGLDVELTYAHGVRVDGGVIGLDDDYDLNPALARFLALNESLIPDRLVYVESALFDYRRQRKKECSMKADVLSYRFLSFVYNQPRDPIGLAESSIALERDLRVRQLMVGSEAIFEAAYKRLSTVGTSEVATWWYIFWDDLWRRNYDAISALRLHSSDFDPHFPTSVAYRPLPRPALEAFLSQRGLFHNVTRRGDFFHHGFLNKFYLRLNEIAFRGSSKVIMFHLGDDVSEVDMEEIDLETAAGPSTMGTGGGTDHDDVSIRARPTYRWEGLLNDPLRRDRRWRRKWFAKFGAWFGITPLWRSGMPSKGISLDVRLENGRYVVISN